RRVEALQLFGPEARERNMPELGDDVEARELLVPIPRAGPEQRASRLEPLDQKRAERTALLASRQPLVARALRRGELRVDLRASRCVDPFPLAVRVGHGGHPSTVRPPADRAFAVSAPTHART